MGGNLRKSLVALVIVVLAVQSAYALSVMLVEKRQAAGEGYPNESTVTVKLPDGNVAQLVTCCGVDRDDSAIYTVRDSAGYTVVDHKFTGGRVYLAQNGSLISFRKNGDAGLVITFYNHLLSELRSVNLIGVYSAVAGDQGSVAVLQKRATGNILRVYNHEGNQRWEHGGVSLGKLYMLPNELFLLLPAADGLYQFTVQKGEQKKLSSNGAVQFIGADPARKLLFVSLADPAGQQVAAVDQDTLQIRWTHKVNDFPAGHCQKMEVGASRYLHKHGILAVLLRCPGRVRIFYVARFLNLEGELLDQHKLGNRVDVGFYELQDKIAIVSDGYLYSFAVRP